MTHAIDSELFSYDARPTRIGVPDLPSWVVSRPHVTDRLALGASGLVTLVTGATGWGKTLAVADWARTAEVPGGLIWLDLAGTDGDPDLFWKLFREGSLEAGERPFAPVPDMGSHERQRQHGLALLGRALRRSGPWVVVLDDFPTGQPGGLAQDLEAVVKHAQRGLRLVVISHGDPAIDVSRQHVAGELTHLTASDLAMDSPEVAQVLARHGVEASELTAMAVQRHAAGWPCGVRLAALALRDAPTLEAALEAADRAAVAYLASEVLAKAPPRARDLIVRTSIVDVVSPDLARAVLGAADEALAPTIDDHPFVEVGDDDSFRCHPLLRAAALAELAREPRAVGQETRRRAAQWYVDQGELSTGLELAISAEDWPWVARTLVESYAVPQILAGSAGDAVELALAIAPVRAAEPLLQTAVSLRQGGVEAAEAFRARAKAGSPEGTGTVADRISAAFVELAAARLRGDTTTGLCLAPRVRNLVSEVPDRQDDLSTMLDAHLGALELCRGETRRAALMLKRGATRASADDDAGSARLDCQGQLALLDAFQGDLRLAERQAASTLVSAGQTSGSGVLHAHLAMAWVHLERREPVPARQHLDRAADSGRDELEPWFMALQLVAESRLLTVTGHPEAALRLLVPAMRAAAVTKPESTWMADLLATASAETLLVSGEPRLALDAVTPAPLTMSVEGAILAASALFELGDLAGAQAVLTPVDGDLSTVPLGHQVGCWLLEARLADQSGRVDRARVLADRALRAAGAETLRRPFDSGATWLSALVDGDPRLRRVHGGFLVGLGASALGHPGRRAEASRPAPLVIETLTVREAQVLGLLAEMCSTDEIATELFLSVNTVKTYVRGILRKLSVNRRVDAVRRGRELGLC